MENLGVKKYSVTDSIGSLGGKISLGEASPFIVAEIEALEFFSAGVRSLGEIKTPEQSKKYRQLTIQYYERLDALDRRKRVKNIKILFDSLKLGY